MSLELRSAYWHDSESKNAFMEYIKQIFGLDFWLWHCGTVHSRILEGSNFSLSSKPIFHEDRILVLNCYAAYLIISTSEPAFAAAEARVKILFDTSSDK